MNNFKRIIKALTDVQIAISICALAAVISINAVEIGLRFILGKSLYWIQDVSLLLMVWMIFPGVTKIVYDRKDITVTLLVDILPSKMKKGIEVFNYILILIFFWILTKYCYQLLLGQIGHKTEVFKIPLVYFTSAVFVNSISITAIYLHEILNVIMATGKEGTA